jgi:hypothetical protein
MHAHTPHPAPPRPPAARPAARRHRGRGGAGRQHARARGAAAARVRVWQGAQPHAAHQGGRQPRCGAAVRDDQPAHQGVRAAVCVFVGGGGGGGVVGGWLGGWACCTTRCRCMHHDEPGCLRVCCPTPAPSIASHRHSDDVTPCHITRRTHHTRRRQPPQQVRDFDVQDAAPYAVQLHYENKDGERKVDTMFGANRCAARVPRATCAGRRLPCVRACRARAHAHAQ